MLPLVKFGKGFGFDALDTNGDGHVGAGDTGVAVGGGVMTLELERAWRSSWQGFDHWVPMPLPSSPEVVPTASVARRRRCAQNAEGRVWYGEPSMDWSRGRSRWMLGIGAFLAFALLLGLEVWKETDELSVTDLLTEAIGIGLLVGCSVCTALLSLRLREQEVAASTCGHRSPAYVRRQPMADRSCRTFPGTRRRDRAPVRGLGLHRGRTGGGLLLLRALATRRSRASGAGARSRSASRRPRSTGRRTLGRAVLSAYFLEELLEPPEQRATGRRNGRSGEAAGLG